MFLESSLLFKTMLILSGQIAVVLATCFYCINGARKAYENNTSFGGMYFRGSMNMNRQLDLVPYTPAPEYYPSEMFKEVPSNGSLIAMSPEGTRAKTKKMRSGFLRIAKAVEGQIFLGAFDFSKKRIVLDKFYNPSGNNEQDLQWVRDYFMQYQAKHPENY